ncbi:MAG: MFS transporter [Gammaproteobacteria bacterium]|nr:MFS transporter [Gammaproteobacteria bacterium]
MSDTSPQLKAAQPVLESHRLSAGVLLAYGSLSFPLAAAFITLQVMVPTYYAETIGLSLSATGLVLLLARLWDMFTDPVVGFFSDRTPPRWGKRRFWVILAGPTIAISVWFLFNPPLNAGPVYLLVWTLAIYVAGTMSIVPMNAWGAELTPDYGERSRVTAFRAAFGIGGTLIALLIAALASLNEAATMTDALTWISLLIVASLIVSTLWAIIRVPDSGNSVLPDNTFIDALRLLRRPTPFRTLLISFLLNNVGNAIPATLFILYVVHVLDARDAAGPLLFLYFCFAAISVPLWLALANRFGKHRAWIMAVLLACASFVWTPLLGPESFYIFVAIVAVTGFATSADLILPSAIMGDLIEWDSLENGYQRPGLFFALWGTVTKLGFALAIGLSFPVLELAGFSATEVNTPDEILLLAMIYGGPCILFKLWAVLLMRNYPINQAEHKRIRVALSESLQPGQS